MARRAGAVRKFERRFGLADAKSGGRALPKKKTEYGQRLEEKQKLKFLYGVLEKQFARYVAAALKSRENPEEILMQQLERRLDVTILRLGWARTLRQARQFVTHGFFKINGKKVNVPSFQLKVSDSIEMNGILYANDMVQAEIKNSNASPWLLRKENTAIFLRIPKRSDINVPVDVKKALELYV